MPAELRPNWKRKAISTDGHRKKAKTVNVEETLKALEQKEKKIKTETEPGIKDYPNSDNENENVSILAHLINQNLFNNKYSKSHRKILRTKSTMKRWMKTMIMGLAILIMAMIIMMKMIIWMMALYTSKTINYFKHFYLTLSERKIE